MANVSYTTYVTGQPPTAGRAGRTIRLTEKGRMAVEYERRRRLHPELDPKWDWVDIPTWMLNSRTRR